MAGGRNETVERERRKEVADYLRETMARAGYRTQAELARDIGVESSRISYWLAGDGRGPDAHSLLRVIRAAEQRKAGSSAPDEPEIARRLQSLEEKLDRAGDATTDVLAGIESRLDDVLRRLGPPGEEATEGH